MESKSEWEIYPDKKPEDGKWVLVAFYDADQKVMTCGTYEADSETVTYATPELVIGTGIYSPPKTYTTYLLAYYGLVVWKYVDAWSAWDATKTPFPDELFT